MILTLKSDFSKSIIFIIDDLNSLNILFDHEKIFIKKVGDEKNEKIGKKWLKRMKLNILKKFHDKFARQRGTFNDFSILIIFIIFKIDFYASSNLIT